MARMPETMLLSDLVIRGETFPFREELKRHGFQWNPDRNQWESGWGLDGDVSGPMVWMGRPESMPDGPAAEEFVRVLKDGCNRGTVDGIEVGYYTGS